MSAKAAPGPFKLPTTLGNTVPVIMPGVSIIPMYLPTVNAEIAMPALNAASFPVSAPVSLPTLPIASIGRAELPGVPSPLPLPLPIVVAEVAQPLSPAGALNELRDSIQSRETIRVNAGKVFDGRRETGREISLPHAKFF